MQTLYSLINDYNVKEIGYLGNVQKIKSTIEIKKLSKFIKGGISKLTKSQLQILTDAFIRYEPSKYYIGNNEFKPDDEQITIIEAPTNNNIRVIAGAGTGKTITIVCRTKYLLDNKTTPDKILILTFNIEARKNLEKLFRKIFGFDIHLEIRTIDSFCRKIINDFNDTNDINIQNYSLSELSILGMKVMMKFGDIICSNYKYIFFDEFQDINKDQFSIIKSFHKNGSIITVIGDDSQNIYQFRGSDNYYIINFDKIIKNTITYKITTNYRSTKEIINLANNSILFNTERIHKNMKTNNKEKSVIDLQIHKTKKNNANNIITNILKYLEEGFLYSDIAILSRNSTSLRYLETEFEKKSIPYVALLSDKYSNYDKQSIENNKIVLSTIHKAKGLEWKIVFIVGLKDIQFPSQMNNGLKNIEEERRVFYVAVTRAKTNLHFCTHKAELPLSRFLKEVSNYIKIKNNCKGITDFFNYYDYETKKNNYHVNNIISKINGKILNKMRYEDLIFDDNPENTKFFHDEVDLSEEIKKSGFNNDYAIYCKFYLTRFLMINNKININIENVENILHVINLTEFEEELYNKYNLKDYFLCKKKLNNIDKNDINDINILIERLENKIKSSDNIKLTHKEIKKKISNRISKYHYPNSFTTKLSESYNLYRDITKKNTEILEAIYYVSLCTRISNDRKRLVYRNIYDIFSINSELILPKIDIWFNKIKNNIQLCNISVKKKYTIDDTNIYITGLIDYIDITTKTLVSIKCSKQEYTNDWLVELLILFSIFKSDKLIDKKDIEITNLGILNILTGDYYLIDIPEDYNYKKMLKYIGKIIEDDRNGVRENYNPNFEDNDKIKLFRKNDLNSLLFCSKNAEPDSDSECDIDDYYNPNEIYVNLDKNIKKTGYMVLDLENNTVNSDIIQIAYIIYDDNHKEIKQVNSYISHRFVDQRAREITKITNNILRTNGKKFGDVMKELLIDLNSVNFLCGHHIHTDVAKIKSNLDKYHIYTSYDIMNNIEQKDTRKLYSEIGGKQVTLSVMYYELFNKKMIDAHDALVDVIHTGKCYVELLKRIKNDNNKKTENNNNKTKNDESFKISILM